MKKKIVILALHIFCASSEFIPVINEKMKSCGSTGVFDLSMIELISYNDTVNSSISTQRLCIDLEKIS